MQSSIDKLHTTGHRLTPQRRLILDILQESAARIPSEHLDAETLYIRAKARDTNISLATVYRSLALLKEIGLVQQHQLGEDHGHFEPIQENLHFHFTCLNCGQVIEFEAPEVLGIVHGLQNSRGLQVKEMHLHLGGYCSACLNNGADGIAATSSSSS
jgi:Fur family ferric uptake transcriptional regulator